MITLNGSSQYAYWDGLAAPRNGLPNQNDLGGVNGFPFWACFDFNPASIPGGSWWAFAFQQRSGSARFAAQLAGSTIQYNDGVAGRSPHSGVQANVWQRVLIYRPSRASTTVYLNGDPATTDTTDSPWPGGFDTMILGGRWESNVSPDLLFAGSFANLAFGNAILPSIQRTGCVVGKNPRSMDGIVRYWDLKANANDAFSAWNLTLAGAPSFTSVGHPDVDAWPPTASGGGRPSRQLQRSRV